MFSIIIPVYNGAKYIEKAIQSVFNQTVKDWELIIVDDGSTDDTADVLKKYNYEKIHIITQKNQGVSVARNNGVSNANGSHIVFLDADDLWHKNHLEVMANLINKYPDAGLYGTFTRTELVNGEVITECNYFKDKDKEVYLEDFFAEYYKDKSAKMFTVITTCIKKEAFDKVGGFPVGCKIGEDLELSLRVAAYYSVVLSSVATATYKKQLSTATKTKSFDADWGFFNTVNDLYNDTTIPKSKRENLRLIMEWFNMRRCRHYIIDGEKSKAKIVFDNLDKSVISKKDILINKFLLMLPVMVVRKIFEARWRGNA